MLKKAYMCIFLSTQLAWGVLIEDALLALGHIELSKADHRSSMKLTTKIVSSWANIEILNICFVLFRSIWKFHVDIHFGDNKNNEKHSKHIHFESLHWRSSCSSSLRSFYLNRLHLRGINLPRGNILKDMLISHASQNEDSQNLSIMISIMAIITGVPKL